MLNKILSVLVIVLLLVGMCGIVNATNENVVIEKIVTNYEQFSSENGGEVVLKISNIELKSKASYKYQLKYNELKTQWYEILDIDFENNILSITLEKAKSDILSILKITDVAYLTIQEIDENSKTKNMFENREIDVSLSLSKGFKVGHWSTGYHAISHTYNVENILYKYVKVQDLEIIESYLEYLKSYDSNRDDAYWGYYMDNIIDEMNIGNNMPNEGWETLNGDTTTTQPTEEGLYFIWIKAPETEKNKEIRGCVFSKRFKNSSVLEEQLEDAKESQKELVATITYDPTTNTTGKVTATIKTNKKVNEVDGWILSEDGMSLTKEYSTNTTETVRLVDIDNRMKDVVVKISNILTEEPKELTKDNTTATDKLPQAGVSATITITLMAITIISVIIYKKYNRYKDIK